MRNRLIFIWILFIAACGPPHLAIIKQNNKLGCIDKKGRVIIKPEWDWMLQGTNNRQIMVERDSLLGFIDARGKVLVTPKYKEASPFYEGLASVGNGKKFGFINTKGDTVIPFRYDDIFLGFSNGLSDVTLNDSCGYIDKSGNVVIPLVYSTCYPFLSNMATVGTFDGQELILDRRGKKFLYDDALFKDELLWVMNTNPERLITPSGQGRINHKGDTIVPPVYDLTGNLSDHMYIVQKDGKWGFYNEKGSLIVSPRFEELCDFQEGYANFKRNGKWGFINKKGTVVVEPVFDYASQFDHGLAYVESEGKSGFVNKKGKFVIEAKFELNRGSKFQ